MYCTLYLLVFVFKPAWVCFLLHSYNKYWLLNAVVFSWQIPEKHEELSLLKLEREKLLSAAADNEVKLNSLTEEIEKSKEELADAQLKYVNSNQEYVALKQLHEELEQKYLAVSENYEQMKLQIEHLSKDAEESKTALDYVKLEVGVIFLFLTYAKNSPSDFFLKYKAVVFKV